jgi:hypothetical protein
VRLLSTLSLVALASTLGLVACGDDDDDISGTAGTSGTGGKTGTAGSGGKTGTAGTAGKAGTAGNSNGGTDTGGTGNGGTGNGGSSNGGTTPTAGTTSEGGMAGEGGYAGEAGGTGDGGEPNTAGTGGGGSGGGGTGGGGTGGGGTGGGGTGGGGTGGGGTGGTGGTTAGTGGGGTGGSGGSGGGTSYCEDGCANLYVPFSSTSAQYSGTYFNISFAPTDLTGATVTARVRTAGTTTMNGAVVLTANDANYSLLQPNSGPNVVALTAAADWTNVTLAFGAAPAGDFDPAGVRSIGVRIQVNAANAGSPINLEVDSVTLSAGAPGPWAFTANANDITVNTNAGPVAGSTVTWLAGAP